MRVALFVPCFVDLFAPGTAMAVVRVLRRLGHEVVAPEGQTCCGQTALNAGHPGEAADLAKRLLDLLAACEPDAVVCPNRNVEARGGRVHPARDAPAPRRILTGIDRRKGATRILESESIPSVESAKEVAMAGRKRKAPADPEAVVGHVRVSTDEQALGLEAQRPVIEACCTCERAALVAVHVDPGASEGTPVERRPGLDQGLDLPAQAGAGVLVIVKRDRLARDVVIGAHGRAAGRGLARGVRRHRGRPGVRGDEHARAGRRDGAGQGAGMGGVRGLDP
jgi:hypothetical protein